VSTALSSNSHPSAGGYGVSPDRRRRLRITLVLALAVLSISAPATELIWSSAAAGAKPPGVRAALSAARLRGVVRLGVDHRPPPLLSTDYEVRRDDGFQGVVADSLSHIWGIPVELVEVAPQDRIASLRNGQVDALFVRTVPHDALLRQAETLSAGYETALAPIMRSDTAIISWQGLAGRTVCIAAGNEAARALAARYGAKVEIAKAPAKSLATMRTGGCDAVLDDAEIVHRLIGQNLGRWDKFSATLLPLDQQQYVFATAKGDIDSRDQLRDVVRRWHRDDQWLIWLRSWVADVDFETYLEQDAPDCH
jgi:polar amino acid transport system substrate-binding protein